MAYTPRFIVSKYVEDVKLIKKTAAERWLSFPWKPWQTHKRVYWPRMIPFEDTYLVSPHTYAKLARHEFEMEGRN